MKLAIRNLIPLLFLCFPLTVFAQFSISGTINDNSASPQDFARVTVFNSDTSMFFEARSNATGAYTVTGVPAGTYTLGATALGMNYETANITVSGNLGSQDFTIAPDSHPGAWTQIMTSPEALGGTDLGILTPQGRLFYCHDTEEPFYFDPAANDTTFVNGDNSIQGCVGPMLLPSGGIMFIGGALQPIYGPGSKKVKTFEPIGETWTVNPDILDFRWYPSVAQLPNGRIVIAGGGDENNPSRTNTSEIYDPVAGTTRFVDTLAIGNEVSPICLMHNGKVLMTHRPPQLFDNQTEQWDLAADFVQGNRMANGDHADHELTVLEDGRVVAMGYKSFVPQNPGNLVEIYDPTQNQWTLGANFAPVRSRCKSVYLPHRKVLVLGGEKEDPNDPTLTNQWNYMNLADLYDPIDDSWRRLAHMNYAREYHANATLVPDGRVIVVGGEGAPGNEPPFSVIEGYEPSYLFKGIRPEIHALNKTEFERGEQIEFEVQMTSTPTNVILMSNPVVTHFMNSGNNRYLDLNFTQNGQILNATIPTDSNTVPIGWYMLMVMVDDIPSVAQIIQITEQTATGFALEEAMSAGWRLGLYPNPSSGTLTATLDLDAAAEIEIDVLNATGQRVGTVTSNHWMDAGIHRFELAFELPTGMYYLRAKSGTNVIAKAMTIAR